MVYAYDSKSYGGNPLRVRVSPPAQVCEANEQGLEGRSASAALDLQFPLRCWTLAFVWAII